MSVVAIIAVVMAMLSACSSAQPAPPGSAGETVDVTPSPSVLDLPLTTTAGKQIRLSDFAGKVVVVSDMMSLCQESCPLDTANVVAAAQAVEKAGLGGRVVFLTVTIDPVRDTLDQLRAFRGLYSPSPADWIVATGSVGGLKQFWSSLGVDVEKVKNSPPLPRNWRTGEPLSYDITHSDDVFFFGPNGHERFLLAGIPYVAAGAPLPPTLKKFMDDEGRSNLANPGQDPWTETQELQVISWLANKHIAANQ
ncbi:MAG: SCO family protein [Nakamurella sp.]